MTDNRFFELSWRCPDCNAVVSRRDFVLMDGDDCFFCETGKLVGNYTRNKGYTHAELVAQGLPTEITDTFIEDEDE